MHLISKRRRTRYNIFIFELVMKRDLYKTVIPVICICLSQFYQHTFEGSRSSETVPFKTLWNIMLDIIYLLILVREAFVIEMAVSYPRYINVRHG